MRVRVQILPPRFIAFRAISIQKVTECVCAFIFLKIITQPLADRGNIR
jgi:hypothetical protein